jgi:putative acetyltransferase
MASPPVSTRSDARRDRAQGGVTRPFVVNEVRDAGELAEVQRLVLAHADARATTPGVEYMRADAVGLPGPYIPPRGGLWLATADDVGIGCVALRPLDGEAAEVKRMFVDAAWRGYGVGRALLEALVTGARARGYKTLRLGTLRDMTAAQSLYHSLGFTPIARYRPDELIETTFYELPLT